MTDRGVSRRRWMKLAGGLVAMGGAGAGWGWRRRQAIRVGLIGTGVRGRHLAMAIDRSIYFPVNGRLVAVCDVDRLRAEAVRNEYAPTAEAMQDARRLLARDDVEAVFIAAPDHAHVPLSLSALAAGKHV